MNKIFLSCLCFILLGLNSLAQKSTTPFDSLLVNTWRFESLEIDKKAVPLSEIQKKSKMIFKKNHTSENIYDDMIERGTWHINERTATVEVVSNILPDEIVSYQILILTANILVLQINNEGNGQNMIFSLYKEES